MADVKLDGVRIQVHRSGDDVAIFSRSLDDLTSRLPEIVETVRALPATELVLDGEALAFDRAGRPQPFQITASLAATRSSAPRGLAPYFFDLLHLEGEPLLDAPGHRRWAALADAVPPQLLVGRRPVSSVEEAREAFEVAVGAGHEGLVLKAVDAPYDVGRRGGAWVKVKPRHTLDLVVLAVEWGNGRRKGWLSNLHLGARDPRTGGFVMLGKTFKGLTDEMLRWQTERFLELAVDRGDWVVTVRPEQVVEIAFDGVQTSPRYPGGVALRFARVIRYRDDKRAAEADTIDDVLRIHSPEREES
jgi:DNA ligase-1